MNVAKPSEHIVKSYDEELKHLNTLISRMGGLVETQLDGAIQAVLRRDPESAESIVKGDAQIDAIEQEVGSLVVRLLALRQPMASDLRVVLTAWRIAGELERVGDLAKNIAKRALILNQDEPIQLTRSVERMGKIAAAHLKQVLDAYLGN